jgi:hypothetical protein
MVGRTAVMAFSETLKRRLERPLGRAFETAANYLRGRGAFLGIAALALVAWGLLFHLMPWIGLDLLDTARAVAGASEA